MRNTLEFFLVLLSFLVGFLCLIISLNIIPSFSKVAYDSSSLLGLFILIIFFVYAPIFCFYLTYHFFKSLKGKDLNKKNNEKKTGLKFRIIKITAIVLGITALLGNLISGVFFLVLTNINFEPPSYTDTEKAEIQERNIRNALSKTNLNLKADDYTVKNYDSKSVRIKGTVKVDFSLKIDSTKKDYIINQIRNTNYFGVSANVTRGEARYNINLENPELFLWKSSSDSLQYYSAGHFIWEEGSNGFTGYTINSGSRDYHTQASFNPKSGILKYRYISNW